MSVCVCVCVSLSLCLCLCEVCMCGSACKQQQQAVYIVTAIVMLYSVQSTITNLYKSVVHQCSVQLAVVVIVQLHYVLLVVVRTHSLLLLHYTMAFSHSPNPIHTIESLYYLIYTYWHTMYILSNVKMLSDLNSE